MFETDNDVDFGAEFTFNFATESFLKTPNNESRIRPIVKRKFPGPAGILPTRKLECLNNNSNKETKVNNSEELPCSQVSASIYQSNPWLDVCNDYKHLIYKYDIQWLKREAKLTHLQKTPFLAGFIKTIECLDSKNPIVKIVLKDSSGELFGTISHSLYETYCKDLIIGAIIVVVNCPVLCGNENHYLTITAQSLVAIYSVNNVKGINLVKPQPQECDDTREDVLVDNLLKGVDLDSFFEDF